MVDEDEGAEQLAFEIEFFEGVLARKPDYFDALNALAYDYTAQGLYDKGLAADRRLAQLRPDDAGVTYNLACSLSRTGHIDAALTTLARAISLGYHDFRHARKDPDLEPLRRDSRFEILLRLARRQVAQEGPPSQ